MTDLASAEQGIRRELEPGERLIWAGAPKQGLLLRASDALLIPFSLMWGGFAFFWEASVIRTDAPFFFKLWGIPFVLVGLYLIVGRFFTDARIRASTMYGLTERRALIIAGFLGRETKSLPLSSIPELTLRESADRSGTITLGAVHPLYGQFANSGWPGLGRYAPPAFALIPEARKVYDLLRLSQETARQRVS